MCPFPPVHGNRTRFAGILQWLRQQGYRTSFILQPLDVDDGRGLDQLAGLVDRLEVVPSPPETSVARFKRAASRLARAVLPHTETTAGVARSAPATARHIDAWCWPATHIAVDRAVARDNPIAVIAEYALLAKCLENLPPPVLKIIDTVEVFFRNQDRFKIDGLQVPVICTPASEKLALGRADVLIAIQRNDARALREAFPEKTVITLPHTCPELPRRPEGPARGTVLYVGSSNPFNVHGLRQFVEHAWPSIAHRVPDAVLRVVGPLPPVPGPTDARILHVGTLIGEPLQREYQAANIVINPQVAGTGLKIKCVEALSAGCALVTNAAGADGLEDEAGRSYLLAADWPEFADHVVMLLTDTKARLDLEVNAKAFADRVFSPSAAFAEFAGILAAHRQSSPGTSSSRGSQC
jgi:hypothetical protein